MSWLLPVPLLLFAGVGALLPLAALVRRPTSAPRLVVEAIITALAAMALVWWRGCPSGCSSNAGDLGGLSP
jgi:hypothetical protein